MARIAFNSMIEEIVGSLAGSTFQDSYFGMQIRTRVVPRNPRSYQQMLRRGEFGYITKSWKNLTPSEMQSWVDAAGTVPAALRLFVGCNINLSLVDHPPVQTFVPSATPPILQIVIASLDTNTLEIIAETSTDQVPVGFMLLVSATDTFSPARTFINRSAYSPIEYFSHPATFDNEVSIAGAWVAFFGALNGERQVGLSISLINIANGLRSDNYFSQAVGPYVATRSIIDTDGSSLTDSDSTIITYI